MKRVDHIGIAVHSLEKSLPFYTEILQLKHLKTEIVESEKVKIAFIDGYNCKIELLEPLSEDSPIAKFLRKKGEGIHHIAFETDFIKETIEELTERGAKLIDQEPKKGALGSLVAFIHPKSSGNVLYELCEKNKE